MYNNAAEYVIVSMYLYDRHDREMLQYEDRLFSRLEPFHAQVKPPLLHDRQLSTPIPLRHDAAQSFA